MLTFRMLVLWLHVGAVVVWAGGLFCLAFVVFPVLTKATPDPSASAPLVETVVRRFQVISWEAIGLLILTGLFNLALAGAATGFSFGAAYLRLLAGKLVLVGVVAGLQAWHGLVLVPKYVALAARLQQPAPGPATQFVRLRRKIFLFLALNFVLAALVIFLGLGLRYV